MPIQNPKSKIQNPKVLVSGIGYTNLSDLSFGRVLLDDLERMSWSEHVHVEDLNFGPIMIYQWFEESPVKFERMVLLSAAKRGREPGTLEVYRWDNPQPDAAEIQLRIEEAVTGVMSLDNLLIICRHFGVLPEEVTIVEIEPQKDDWGMEFSPVVAAKVGEALETVRAIAEQESRNAE
ncbi:MAG: hydrogenase maturation protease [Pyrinomonadaceae bacterium MAG19_C2-C3]|nr:hydrogenase maturation protease [Pyrinomonadaceae bacterium MAG19_C2-C3]